MPKQFALVTCVAAAVGVGVSCSSSGRVTVAAPQPPVATPPAPPPAAVTPVDPVTDLLASADRHFEEGRNELTLGYLARAKASFNEALEVLLESPLGIPGDARLREHFERLV